MKKILSMLITLSMLLSFAVTVNAEMTGSGNEWTGVTTGNPTVNLSYALKRFAGEHSAQIIANDNSNRTYWYAPLTKKSTSGVYNVSFYSTNGVNNGYNKIVAVSSSIPSSNAIDQFQDMQISNNATLNYTSTEELGVDGNKWYKYEKKMTVADANYVVFGMGSWGGYFELDNIVITDENNNVLFAEGFGTDTPPADVTEPQPPEEDIPMTGIIPFKSGNTWTGEGTVGEKDLEYTGNNPIGGIAASINSNNTRYYAPLKNKSANDIYNIVFYTTVPVGTEGYDRSVHLGATSGTGANDSTLLSRWTNEWVSSWTITPPTDGSKWYKYESRVSVPNAEYVIFLTKSSASYLYVDEITIKDDNGTVLFYEGFEKGFEPVFVEDKKWQVVSTAGYVYNEKGTVGNTTNYLVVNPANAGKVLWKAPFGYFSADEELTVSYDMAVSCGGSNLKVGLERGGMVETDASWDTTTGYINATDGWTITDITPEIETIAGKCANKWYHIDGKVSYSSGNYTPEYFVIQANGWEQMRVDNILVKNAKGEVIFSEDWEGTATKDGHYEWPYYISGAVANGSSDKIILSWTNPGKKIQEIKIFENGEEIQESKDDIDKVNKEANAFNTFFVYPEDENVHTYTIKYLVDGVLAETSVSGKIGSFVAEVGKTNNGYSLKNATFGKHSYAKTDVMGGLFIDTETRYSGENALRINPNITEPQAYGNWERVQLVYNVGGFKINGKYKLKFMLKVVDGGGVDVAVENIDWVAATNNWVIAYNSKMTTQWMPVETVFTANAETQYIKIDFNAPAKAVYIDDIVVTDISGNIIYKEDYEYSTEVITPVFNEVDSEGNVITANINAISKGKIEAVATIINGSIDQYDANAYLALYDSTNRLLKIDAVSAEIPMGVTATVRCLLDTGDLEPGTYTLKSFIWEPDMSPIETAFITGTITE